MSVKQQLAAHELLHCCELDVGPAIEIPDAAFSDPDAPLDSEATTWTQDDTRKQIAGQLYYATGLAGSAGNPEFVWSDNGNGTIIRIKG